VTWSCKVGDGSEEQRWRGTGGVIRGCIKGVEQVEMLRCGGRRRA
jgi:hypothetical protein